MGIDLPSSLFSDSVDIKDVLYFTSEYLETDEPHYFICIQKNKNDVLLFCMSSTQKDKIVKNRIHVQKMPSETIVIIKSSTEDPESPLKQTSNIDCNTVREISRLELKSKFERNEIKIRGAIATKIF